MDDNIDCEDDSGFKVGMVFESKQEAYDAYNMYGICVGFSIRRHKFYTLPNGDLVKRQFCCSLEGKPSKKQTPKKARHVSRTECEAIIEIRLKEDIKYHVTNKLSRLALTAAYKSARTKESGVIAKSDFLQTIRKVEGVSSPSKENQQGVIYEDSFEVNLSAHISIRDPICKNTRGLTSKRKKSGLEINAKDKRGKPKRISKRVVQQRAIKQKLQQAMLDGEEILPSDDDDAQEETQPSIQTEVVENSPFEMENTTQMLYQDTVNNTSFVSDELLHFVYREHNGSSLRDEAFIELYNETEQVFNATSPEKGGPACKLEFRRSS